MMVFRRTLPVLILLVIAASKALGAGDDENFDRATGLRIAHYRAAVPDTVKGGVRVDRDRVDLLLKDGAVLIDVMPSEGAGPDPDSGIWRLSRTHQTIPGATWLPDVGRGRITTEYEAYFRDNLDRLTNGDTRRPVVVFCQSDCWMSWNAIQRAANYGYSHLYWFPDGTDGWVEWGDRKLQIAKPVPMLPKGGGK